MKKEDIEKCLKDKDKRISALENKLSTFRWYFFGSIYLILLIVGLIGLIWCSAHLMNELPNDTAEWIDGEDHFWKVNIIDPLGLFAFPVLLMFAIVGFIISFVLLGTALFEDKVEYISDVFNEVL